MSEPITNIGIIENDVSQMPKARRPERKPSRLTKIGIAIAAGALAIAAWLDSDRTDVYSPEPVVMPDSPPTLVTIVPTQVPTTESIAKPIQTQVPTPTAISVPQIEEIIGLPAWGDGKIDAAVENLTNPNYLDIRHLTARKFMGVDFAPKLNSRNEGFLASITCISELKIMQEGETIFDLFEDPIISQFEDPHYRIEPNLRLQLARSANPHIEDISVISEGDLVNIPIRYSCISTNYYTRGVDDRRIELFEVVQRGIVDDEIDWIGNFMVTQAVE